MTIKNVEMIPCTLNGAYNIILPKHRADRPEWYTPNGWERPRLRTLKAQIDWQISKGIEPVVFYVGSEEGEMPALCQMWGAKVVMFEPNPRVIPNTKAIYEANKLENPAGFFVGFAANETNVKGEPVHLDQFPPCADGEIIGDHGFKELAFEADTVPTIKIDDLVAETGLIPTIITTDCEGSDWEVLKGAEETLKTHHPSLMISWHPEFMFRMFDAYTGDARKWVKDLGYHETFIDYQHEVHMLYVRN